MKALRNSDATIQLMPFDQDENDQDLILDTESLIPDDPTKILTWVRGISSTTRRIYFSIRVSNTCLLRELRTDIFGWCKTNRCWIDMDYIASEKLFSCGWICGIHPRLYNRNDLLQWIGTNDSTGALMKKIKLYPRTIFTVDDHGAKTITNAIVVDGSLEHSKQIMEFLYKIEWDKRYKNVSFVPFRTSNILTKDDQKQAMQYHNNYLNNTYRKLIRIANPDKQYKCEDDAMISFRQWLIQSQLHGKQMIQGVETMKDDIVRLIYNKHDQKGVDFITQNLRQNVIEAFGNDIADDMLGADFDIVTRFDNEMEEQHATKIKYAWQGKKLENTAPPVQQHTLFYGSNKSENLYPSSENKSYSSMVQNAQQQSRVDIEASKKENEELRKMVEALQVQFKAMESKHNTFAKDLKENLKRELTREFEGMITEFKKDMYTTIENYEKNALAREERMNAQNLNNFRIVARELLSNNIPVTPSENTQESATVLRGGAQ